MDIGESMGGPKIQHAKELARVLLSIIDEKFYINLIVFNESINEWRPEGGSLAEDAFPCTNENLESARVNISSKNIHIC